jgi:hypothetical protein
MTDIAGEAALVPPLRSPGDLQGAGAIVVASDAATDRLDVLEEVLAESPETPLFVMGDIDRLRRLTRAVTGLEQELPYDIRASIAHPAVVAAATVLKSLSSFVPAAISIAATDPVSSFGQAAVECVARQAARRLQGEPVSELVDNKVLAFNVVTEPDPGLEHDARDVLGVLPWVAQRVFSGCFHGHLAQLAIRLEEPADLDQILDLWFSDPLLSHSDVPVGLDAVVDTDQVVLPSPHISDDGRLIAVTAMMDGLRIGGALSAVRALLAVFSPGAFYDA